MIANYFSTYLHDNGAGVLGTDLFVSNRPDSPNDLICLYDETGIVSDYQSDYGSDWTGLLVMVRGSYAYSHAKIWEIHNLITGINGIDTDDFYLSTSRTQTPPAQIDIDQHGRRTYTAHYLYLIAQKTNTHRITLINQ